MNDVNPTGMLFLMVLFWSAKRSRNRMKTCLISVGVSIGVSFGGILLGLFFPLSNLPAIGILAADIGRLAGVFTAVLYSRKTKADAIQSIYLLTLF